MGDCGRGREFQTDPPLSAELGEGLGLKVAFGLIPPCYISSFLSSFLPFFLLFVRSWISCLPFCWAMERIAPSALTAGLVTHSTAPLHQHHGVCPSGPSIVRPQSSPSGRCVSLSRCAHSDWGRGCGAVFLDLGSLFFLTPAHHHLSFFLFLFLE